MAYESSIEERILMALARIERKLDKLDEIDRNVKAAEQEIHRVKVEARNRGLNSNCTTTLL